MCTCISTVVAGRQGHVPCEIVSQVNFVEMILLSHSCGESGRLSFFDIFPDF